MRLGAGGPEEVKKHPWFKNISWEDLSNRKLRAPYLPNVDSPVLFRLMKIILMLNMQMILGRIWKMQHYQA